MTSYIRMPGSRRDVSVRSLDSNLEGLGDIQSQEDVQQPTLSDALQSGLMSIEAEREDKGLNCLPLSRVAGVLPIDFVLLGLGSPSFLVTNYQFQ